MDTTHQFEIDRNSREKKNGHKGQVIWLTGLSGSGKSTIANLVEKNLFNLDKQVTILDGDDVRTGLCSDLGFSQEDRAENLRRIAHTAKLFCERGFITICCFVSPLNSQREMIKKIIGDDFKLVFINTSLEDCEKRDPKGLYKKARAGEIKNFTGIDSAFETPNSPDLIIDTTALSAEESAKKIINELT